MTLAFRDDWIEVHGGDCREVLAALSEASVQTVITSPPYWGLRDYGMAGQLGLEDTPEEYVDHLVEVFREVRRVLRSDGTLWLNLGDSYAAKKRGSDLGWAASRLTNPGTVQKAQAASLRGTGERHRGKGAGVKEKDLIGIPWRVAFALQADGWYLRSDIIWAKPNPMPESVTDRPTKAHEYLFLLSRSPRYHYDAEAIREPGTETDARALSWDRETKEADVPGQTSRQHRRGRRPSGWAEGPGAHSTIEHNQGTRQKGPRTAREADLELVASPATARRAGGLNARIADDVAEGRAFLGRNRRDVWSIATQPYPGAHFATFPEKLVEPCILAGCPAGGTVLDPFAGTGTVGLVAQRLSRRAVLIDLNPDYIAQCLERNQDQPLGLVEAAS